MPAILHPVYCRSLPMRFAGRAFLLWTRRSVHCGRSGELPHRPRRRRDNITVLRMILTVMGKDPEDFDWVFDRPAATPSTALSRSASSAGGRCEPTSPGSSELPSIGAWPVGCVPACKSPIRVRLGLSRASLFCREVPCNSGLGNRSIEFSSYLLG